MELPYCTIAFLLRRDSLPIWTSGPGETLDVIHELHPGTEGIRHDIGLDLSRIIVALITFVIIERKYAIRGDLVVTV